MRYRLVRPSENIDQEKRIFCHGGRQLATRHVYG